MTPADQNKLASLLRTTDVIEQMVNNRPAIADGSEIADGWERATKFLISLANQTEEKIAESRYVKIDPKI